MEDGRGDGNIEFRRASINRGTPVPLVLPHERVRKVRDIQKSPGVIHHPRMIAWCRESYSFQCVHSCPWLKAPGATPPPFSMRSLPIRNLAYVLRFVPSDFRVTEFPWLEKKVRKIQGHEPQLVSTSISTGFLSGIVLRNLYTEIRYILYY